MTNNQFDLNEAGLYIHVPFCEKKCAYCDFYSSFLNDELLDKYLNRLIELIKQWGGNFHRPINTIYFGGGTPSLMNNRLIPLLNAIKKYFTVEENSEITLELNPSHNTEEILKNAKHAGINRLSIGAQSGQDKELKELLRTHTVSDTVNAFKKARELHFENISLDLMIALQNSNISSLDQNIDFILSLEPEHISSYILKIEENTAFYKNPHNYYFLNDDEQAEQYLHMCERLENKGYFHYEISNFCKKDKYSRHNLKYWYGADYLGIGPSAHSLINKKRFYYSRDIKAFLNGEEPLYDGTGSDKEEYIMLRLRLKSGINFEEYKIKFGEDFPLSSIEKCKKFEKAELLNISSEKISLTDKGMLVSNSIITELLE